MAILYTDVYAQVLADMKTIQTQLDSLQIAALRATSASHAVSERLDALGKIESALRQFQEVTATLGVVTA